MELEERNDSNRTGIQTHEKLWEWGVGGFILIIIIVLKPRTCFHVLKCAMMATVAEEAA